MRSTGPSPYPDRADSTLGVRPCRANGRRGYQGRCSIRGKPSAPRPKRRQPAEEEIERLLDWLDDAILSGDPQDAGEILQQLSESDPEGTLVASMLAGRLIAGKAATPPAAFDVLETAGGMLAPFLLTQIYDSPDASDMTRFEARRRHGWPESSEKQARRKFLSSLRDADATIVKAVIAGSGTWPPETDFLEEALAHLLALPDDRRQALVGRIVDEVGRPALPLFHALLHHPAPALQRLVMDQLLTWRDPASTGPLDRLARTARSKQRRGEAIAALERLRSETAETLVGSAEQQVNPPLHRAYLSPLDGDGGPDRDGRAQPAARDRLVRRRLPQRARGNRGSIRPCPPPDRPLERDAR